MSQFHNLLMPEKQIDFPRSPIPVAIGAELTAIGHLGVFEASLCLKIMRRINRLPGDGASSPSAPWPTRPDQDTIARYIGT